MKTQLKHSTLAAAVAALVASPAFANGNGENGPLEESYSVSVNNEIDVKLKKEISVTKDIEISGEIGVTGMIPVFSSSMAVVDDKQINTSNEVENTHHVNNASASDNAMDGASGNIGLNITAGDNNMQDNAAALSAADAYFVFGSADAEIFVTQANAGNRTYNSGNINNASLSGSVLSGAAGNIGVNVSAGSSNLQKNNMAVSVAPSRLSEASVANVQRSTNNYTSNEGRRDEFTTTTQVTVAGTMSGSYSGISDQYGDVYIDNWNAGSDGSTTHPTNGGTHGHSDFDRFAQGAQDRNRDGGALSFNEAGNITLAGTLSGTVTTTGVVYTPTVNNASLSGDALSGASGNIGVNVTSGTGNMQSNSLAVAHTSPALCTACPGNGGGVELSR